MTDNVAALETWLAGLDYPMSREDLIRCAQEQGLDTETLQALLSAPLTEVASADEVRNMLSELR
jgi:hypothetical protein